MMDPVSEQYEAYPYPARDPSEEGRRLVRGSPGRLAEVDHWGFGGRPPGTLRALFAGGGTGDGLVMLAQETADAGRAAEIHYLDLSRASRSVAEARIAARGLSDRVVFHTGSLLDAAAHGPFDYVDCCGVLHHLPDPDAGLRALHAALAPGGVLGLMVYGEIGRTGVYHAQEMLRLVAGPDSGPPPARVAAARALIEAAPPTNWLKRNTQIGDWRDGDAGIFDLLLHARDRAYRIDALLEALTAAGFALNGFAEPMRYDPATWLRDPDLRARAAALSFAQRALFSELLCGNLRKHVLYARRAADPAPDLSPGRDAVVGLIDLDPAALARAARAGPLKVNIDGIALAIPFPPGADAIIARLDGRARVGDIASAPGVPRDPIAFNRLFGAVWARLNGMGKALITARRG